MYHQSTFTFDSLQASELARFHASYIIDSSGCWLWVKSGNLLGYGQFFYRGRYHTAHRISYLIYYGELPEGKDVCHRCDVRGCVNPAHLYIASHLENMRDMYRRGRNPLVRVTDEEIDAILEDYDNGWQQVDLARKYGISQGHISRIVRGVRRKIADY